jgi:threonine dehydratase
VLVPVGGAGLIGGIAAWCSGAVRVVGVEPERSPTLSAALEVGQPVDVDVSGVAADSLGARRVGLIGFQIARAWVDRVCLVDDAAIVRARRALWDAARIAAEPGAAAPLAALLAYAFEPEPDERVVLVVSGGNADVADLQAPPGPTGP